MKRTTLLIVFALVLALGCQRSRTVQRTETIMGTQVTITVVGDTPASGQRAIEEGMAELRRLDSLLSLYQEESEISRINRAAGVNPVPVSAETLEAVERGLETGRLTSGAFDVTVGPLVVLWQMRLKEGTVPTDAEIANVLPLVNYRNVVADRRSSTVFLKKRGMILDVGGSAKGYAADRVKEIFRKNGIANAVIAVAGDIWALGRREDGKPWRIGVQHPRDKDKVLTVLELRDRYISTSGDYERFVIRGKRRYHHIIDPRTGKPAEGIVAVTVMGDRGAVIDPLTTALFVLGKEKGMRLVEKIGAEAIFVDNEGQVTATGGIKLTR